MLDAFVSPDELSMHDNCINILIIVNHIQFSYYSPFFFPF
jgi:hypothetical protein